MILCEGLHFRPIAFVSLWGDLLSQAFETGLTQSQRGMMKGTPKNTKRRNSVDCSSQWHKEHGKTKMHG